MVYRACIFDLDGTLVHTTPEYRYDIVGRILKNLGVSCASQEMIDAVWFRSNRNGTIERGFGVSPVEFWEVFREYDTSESRKKSIQAYDDVIMLKELKGRGVSIGVVTGAPRRIAHLELELVERVLDANYIDYLVLARRDSGIEPKPHPHGLHVCMGLLGIEPNHTPYVGNGDEDAIAARAAGALDVIIDRGEHAFDHPQPPSRVIRSLYELREIVLDL